MKVYNLLIKNYKKKKMDVSNTQLVISSELKYKVDIYVRYVNIFNVVIFAKTLIIQSKTRAENWQ